MVKAKEGRRRLVQLRSLVLGGGIAVLLCAAALLAGSAWAAAPTGFGPGGERDLPVPGAFRLQASNGYSLVVLADQLGEGGSGGILIFAYGAHGGVQYSVPATVTKTSIEAELGALGRISVAFQRSGRAAKYRCGEQDIAYDSGRYVGTIEFHGEEGYTDVEATSVRGDVKYQIGSFCDGGSLGSEGSEFGHSRPGAELEIRNPALGPQLWVVKDRPSAAALIEADVREYSTGIAITRYMSLRISAGRFTFDRRLRTATLRPPAPFAGSAKFDLGKKAGQRWSGDLTVDMPGRDGVALTGSALRATLVPAG